MRCVVVEVGRKFPLPGMLLLVLLAVLLAGCRESAAESRHAPQDFRKEKQALLDTLLTIYDAPADSLERAAAGFLVADLDIQYAETSDRLRALVDTLKDRHDVPVQQLNMLADSLHTRIRASRHRVIQFDAKVMTAEILRDNIDYAVMAWKSAPWREEVPFDIFHNYILPYKSGDGPVVKWRSHYAEAFSWARDSLVQCTSTLEAAGMLLPSLRKQFRYLRRFEAPGNLSNLDLLALRAGQCYEWTDLAVNTMRAFGIPSVELYSPNWANHRAGHSWLGIVDSAGRVGSYNATGLKLNAFDPMSWPLKTSKVFMERYVRNPDWLTGQPEVGDQELPKLLADPRIVDITADLIPVTDVPVALARRPSSGQVIAYLCIFPTTELSAMAWSRIKGDSCVFRDMGRDALYVPAYYIDGQYEPASEPLIISFDGEIRQVLVDTVQWDTMRVYRKYPLRGSMFTHTQLFKGMKIQVAADSAFSDTTTIHTLTRIPSPVITDWVRQKDRWEWAGYIDSIVFENPLEARFLRFLAAPGRICRVGEIMCYDAAGQRLTAHALGSKPGAQNILDGVYGEAFEDTDILGWVGLDFGQMQEIAKIRWLPSHDSNSIQVGERYELLYWSNGWHSLGEQTASVKFLDFRAPRAGLFWLRNLDTGKEERPFTYDGDSGELMWW